MNLLPAYFGLDYEMRPVSSIYTKLSFAHFIRSELEKLLFMSEI